MYNSKKKISKQVLVEEEVNVLVIESEDELKEFIKETLEEQGFQDVNVEIDVGNYFIRNTEIEYSSELPKEVKPKDSFNMTDTAQINIINWIKDSNMFDKTARSYLISLVENDMD